MKKIWIYLLGILTGIVITILTLVILAAATNGPDDHASKMIKGMTFFEEPSDVIETSSVKVFQSLSDGVALAYCKEKVYDFYGDPVVLLYNENGIPYYDDQIINLPSGKGFRQVGIYRYSSKISKKTVPIVMIMDL